MNINLDDDIRQARMRYPENKPSISPSHLFFIIVLAVFIANMLSWGAQRGIEILVAAQMLKAATEGIAQSNAKTQARLEEQSKQNAVLAKQKQIEQEKKQAGLRQAMETCNFWRDQYKNEPSSSNQYQRDQSCNFVNEFR